MKVNLQTFNDFLLKISGIEFKGSEKFFVIYSFFVIPLQCA